MNNQRASNQLDRQRCMATVDGHACNRRAAVEFGGFAVCTNHIEVLGEMADALTREAERRERRR